MVDVVAADAIEHRQYAVAADAANAETLVAAPVGGADRNTRLEADQIVQILGHFLLQILGGNHGDRSGNVLDRARKPPWR